jgi:hypothetical protein
MLNRIKKFFKDIEVDSSLPLVVLKPQLFSLTNIRIVPIERQKIMVKRQTIDDDTWKKVNLTNGLTLLMIGSSDPVLELPTEKNQIYRRYDRSTTCTTYAISRWS